MIAETDFLIHFAKIEVEGWQNIMVTRSNKIGNILIDSSFSEAGNLYSIQKCSSDDFFWSYLKFIILQSMMKSGNTYK